MSSDVIRIVLVDECTIFRQGLRSLLDQELDSVVVGQGESGLDAVTLTHKHQPDVIIMDPSNSNGIAATREIRKMRSGTKVLWLSEHCGKLNLANLINADISGYVLKTDDFEDLAIGVRALHAGKNYFSPPIGDYLARILRQSVGETGEHGHAFTAREGQILQLIADGRSTREIASDLCVSLKTVETHRKNMMDKLDIRSVALLTIYAIRDGVTSLG